MKYHQRDLPKLSVKYTYYQHLVQAEPTSDILYMDFYIRYKFPPTSIGVLANCMRTLDSSLFTPNQEILSTFRLKKQNKTNSWGGGKFLKSFSDQLSRQIKQFQALFFLNCGNYFCLLSTKIVVTMFACHLHNSSGMCLHLARTNMS